MDELKRLSDGGSQVVHQRGVYQRVQRGLAGGPHDSARPPPPSP
jgi:hypothetical protein